MSLSNQRDVECPNCHKKAKFRIWQSINTVVDPDMRKKVKDGSAFVFHCPQCGQGILVDFEFIYHQMEDSIMISYFKSEEMSKEMLGIFKQQGEDGPFGEEMKAHGYLLRHVRSQNALREKIYIFDDGLDDRIIEMYKVLLRVHLYEDKPEYADRAEILYNSKSKPQFELLVDGEGLGAAPFDKVLYANIQKEYGKFLSDMRKDGPVIDENYAMSIFDKSKDSTED